MASFRQNAPRRRPAAHAPSAPACLPEIGFVSQIRAPNRIDHLHPKLASFRQILSPLHTTNSPAPSGLPTF
jgi:hypothetical protein